MYVQFYYRANGSSFGDIFPKMANYLNPLVIAELFKVEGSNLVPQSP